MAKILFIGDIAVTGRFIQPVVSNDEIFGPNLLNLIKSADYTIANLEGPVTNSKEYLKCDGLVVQPINTIEYLAERGISIFNVANNHIFDNGLKGFRDTVKFIKREECDFFGAGENKKEAARPLIINENQIKIAIWGLAHKEGLIANEVSPGIFYEGDIDCIGKEISNYKTAGYHILINYHGGEEFSLIPSPTRRKILNKLLKFGAHTVISNHSHVAQGYEETKNGLIFNSLGNFIFDIEIYRHIPYVDESLIIELNLKENRLIDFKLHPVAIDFNRPILEIEANNNILKRLLYHSNLKNYYTHWQKEALRIVRLRKIPRQGNIISNSKKSRVEQVKRIIKQLVKSPIKRDIYFWALIAKLRNKT